MTETGERCAPRAQPGGTSKPVEVSASGLRRGHLVETGRRPLTPNRTTQETTAAGALGLRRLPPANPKTPGRRVYKK